MLVDAHCHLISLYSNDDNSDVSGASLDRLQQVWERAEAAGIKGCLTPSVVRSDWLKLPEVMSVSDRILGAVGIHPQESEPPLTVAELTDAVSSNSRIVGIGETGLDFSLDASPQEKIRQIELFKTHIQVASKLNKLLIVHVRDAWQELMQVMRKQNYNNLKVMIHCFTGNYEQAKEALDAGFYLSFSGILTFKKSDYLREVFKKIPLEKILLETDAPFLAPVPMRGKMNEPAYLVYTANTAAELRDLKASEMMLQATNNFYNLIGA